MKAVMDPEAHYVQYTPHFMFFGTTEGDSEKFSDPLWSPLCNSNQVLSSSLVCQTYTAS
jgi:hypothetical protein